MLSRKRELYGYFHGVIKKRQCRTIRIGGIEDHVHILVDLHPSVALADLVKILKQGSTNWLKENRIFPMFGGWSSGYFAASVGIEGKDKCVEYIKNQELHHKRISYVDEIRDSLEENELEWIEQDW